MAVPNRLSAFRSEALEPVNIFNWNDGHSNALVLVASTSKNMTAPDGATAALIQTTGIDDVWMEFDATATLPTDTTDGTAPILNPNGCILPAKDGTTVLHFISLGTPTVNVVFFM